MTKKNPFGIKRLFDFDKKFRRFDFVAGVDEAGRGPLAGPVVSAAVILEHLNKKSERFQKT